MARRLITKPLQREQIAQAFPLVQIALGDISLPRWRAFAAQLVTPRGRQSRGIVTVQSKQDYIYGLFVYRVRTDLRHRRVLEVELVAAADLVDAQAPIEALIRAMEDTARALDCGAIHTMVLSSDRADDPRAEFLMASLTKLGHRIEGISTCKPLDHLERPQRARLSLITPR